MRVRVATVADAGEIARAHAEWRRGYLVGLVPSALGVAQPSLDSPAYWRGILAEQRSPEVAVLLAEDDAGRLVGAAHGGPLRRHELRFDGELDYDGELYDLFVVNLPGTEPETKARRALVRGVAGHLRQIGRRSMLAWCLDGGLTCSAYLAMGGVRLDQVDVRDDFGLRYAPYGWPDIALLLES
jgi:hypothetical protein